MKPGTQINHGRSVIILNDGAIYDVFYKNDIKHGPYLIIDTNGEYYIK